MGGGVEPCASGSRGTQDAPFPWARWSRGSANRTTIFSIHRCSSESSLSDVTALALKLPPVTLVDLSQRQLTGVKEASTGIFGVSFSLLIPFAFLPSAP